MKYFFSIFLMLLLSACSTINVETDFNPEFSFNSLKTYAVIHKNKTGDDTLANDRIIEAINSDLRSKGYRTVSREEADYLVLFHTDVRNKTRIDTDYQHVGMYPYRYGYRSAMMVPTTRTYTYDEGKLIIDFVEPAENKIFWRGIATDRLKSFDSPEERIKYIHDAIGSLLKTFPATSAASRKK
ncbi:MAG: DUF4136 domain-containing protein [Campylobacterota bacterium]|nr:DUF4136 domain-containing protein [Campylobacterota bacterium]